MAAATCPSRRLVDSPKTLTVIDYSLPSTEPRLWVLDLQTGHTLYQEVVAHGRGSGGNMATMFSNARTAIRRVWGSSSRKIPTWAERLLDASQRARAGINDQARARAIVMHGAQYVDPAIAAAQGRLGRSWGCPALRPAIAKASDRSASRGAESAVRLLSRQGVARWHRSFSGGWPPGRETAYVRFATARWLMRLAMHPAPKPLSMFTTDTPLAQLFSIPSSAARPPKLAP